MYGGACNEVIGDTYSNDVEPPSISSLTCHRPTGVPIRIRKQPPGDPARDPAPKGRMVAHAWRPPTHNKWPTLPIWTAKMERPIQHCPPPNVEEEGTPQMRYTRTPPSRGVHHEGSCVPSGVLRSLGGTTVALGGTNRRMQSHKDRQTTAFVGIKISCKQFEQHKNTPKAGEGYLLLNNKIDSVYPTLSLSMHMLCQTPICWKPPHMTYLIIFQDTFNRFPTSDPSFFCSRKDDWETSPC